MKGVSGRTEGGVKGVSGRIKLDEGDIWRAEYDFTLLDKFSYSHKNVNSKTIIKNKYLDPDKLER